MRVGLIGGGYWGKNYIKTLDKMNGVDLGWIYNRQNEIPRNKLPLGTQFTKDYMDVINDQQIEGIIISTPPSTHYHLAKIALQSGKDVLLEKPMTSTSREAERLINLARKSERVLMVGHIYQYNSALMDLKKIVDEGDLGKISHIYSERAGYGPFREDINAMWNLAPHDISIIGHLTGSNPLNVRASGFSIKGSQIEDIVQMNLEYPNGITASVRSSWIDPQKIRKTIVFGNKKIAIFDDTIGEKLKIYDAKTGKLSWNSKRYNENPLENQCRHFVECSNNREIPRTNGEEGYENMRTLESAQESLEQKGNKIIIRH